MLLFGLALVLMMLFRPAGILPSAVRKRELAAPSEPMSALPTPRRRAALLEASGITKRFGGVQALVRASLLASAAARSTA